MNCKYCNAELPEDATLCPACGKEQQETEEICMEPAETCEETAVAEEIAPVEEAPAEETASGADAEPAAEDAKEPVKPTPGKIALAVVAIIVVLAVLISLIVSGSSGAKTPEDPTEETVEVTMPSNGDPTSPLCKASYTVSDEEAAASSDVVVATVGDRVLTNGELQAYYWQEIYLFLQEYGSYVPYIGLDPYSPLDKQLSPAGEISMSWQQFFLDSAIYSWHNYQSMALEGEAVGHQMSADRQAELDNLPADLEESVAYGSYESVDAMIKDNIGAACTKDAYLKYVDVYYHGLAFYYDHCEALDPADEEVEAFFAENEEAYAGKGLTRDSRYVDVRHVLLQPEGGEAGEDGYPVYTEEAWEACRVKAEEIYAKWQEGDKSEDSFAELAKENSVDGSASSGGLYQNIYKGQMVEEFENWCFDESRQIGDHGLVKTQYGYHIMYFSRVSEYADVRYVLLQPENGETGEDGVPTYTDEAWEACRIKAEEIYGKWQEGELSEESFAQLAEDYAEDIDASVHDVYENLFADETMVEFDNWCFDETRQAGDHGLVKTPYGYYIMFYVNSRGAWFVNARLDWISDEAFDYVPEIMEKYPMVIDYSKIALGDLKMG